MTTIAYHHKDKTISIDSRTTQGDLIATDTANKVRNNEIGTWFITGVVGDMPDFMTFKHNFKPELIPDCSAFLISEGKVYCVIMHEGYCIYTEIDCNSTLGSGSDFALAAMDFGKGSKDAIKYAMTRDSATGGKIQTVKVK